MDPIMRELILLRKILLMMDKLIGTEYMMLT
jgi:hypothetical protein